MNATMKFSLHLSDTSSEETRSSILAPLVAYNASQAGPSGSRGLAIEVRDAEGATIGGLWGNSGYDWLFVHLLVVPEPLRGQGVGKQLMSLAETEATTRGCRGVWLDTFEFQARSFYERIGYECFGELGDYPKGFSRFFMKKVLARSPLAEN
ncbi:GNAT family N-acetyltransferase [soil metagenome]